MPYICTLHESLPTKDLCTAVDRFLELWERAEVIGETTVHILVQTTHRAAVHVIAEVVPPDTRGFGSHENTGENRTAAEMLASEESDDGPAWNGSFSNDIAPDLVRPLLLRIRGLSPDPLRRTSLNLRVRNVRWRASPTYARGAIVLTDFKIFQRKVRFRLDLAYETRDDLPKRDIEAELKAVAEATGLDFASGEHSRQVQGGAWTTEQNAVAALLFREVVERVSQTLLGEHFDWSHLPGAFANGEGMRRRFAALTQGPKEDFRWDADLTELMRAVLPEFRLKKGVWHDAKTYVAPVEGPWLIAVIFDTHPGLRIGRLFKLRCGVLAIDEKVVRFKRSAPMLRCSGGSYHETSDTCPEFSFNTHAELTAILEGLRSFVPDFIARFRSQLNEVLLPGWVDLGAVFPTLRRVTARAALDEAADFLQQQGLTSAQLVGASLGASPNSLVYRQDRAAELPRDGTSGLLYQWSVRYVIGSTTLEVSIPPGGMLALSRSEMDWLHLNPHLAPKRIQPPIIDSGAAAMRMHEMRDKLRVRYPDMTGVVGQLELKRLEASSVWTAQIEFSPTDPEKHDWVLIRPAVDAMTGELIRTDFDERFSDAPQTQRTFTE